MGAMLKFTALIFLLIPLSAICCPAGMTPGVYGFGNAACLSGQQVRQVAGSLRRCPSGFHASQDEYGNAVCSDGRINAYDLSAGCPTGLSASWDAYGRTVCLDGNNGIVVELRGDL